MVHGTGTGGQARQARQGKLRYLARMGCRSFPQTNVVDAPKKSFYFHTRVDHSRTNLGAEKRESRVPNPSCPPPPHLPYIGVIGRDREEREEKTQNERPKGPLTFLRDLTIW